MSKSIELFGLVEEDAVNAPGISLTIFCQGCWHPEDTPDMVGGHCVNCHNPLSHPRTGGTAYSVEAIMDILKANPLHKTLVVSGGEPVCQAEALQPLLQQAKDAGYKVWLYTGYTFEQLRYRKEWEYLKDGIDVLVDGPFIEHLKSTRLHYRGSKNQRLIDIPKTAKANKVVLYKKNAEQAVV